MESFQDNLVKKLGKDNLKKIQSVRIGLAGAGGLGSNCALNLVRVGFKKFTIVDFDVVSPANLDRQFYFLDQVRMVKVEALKINLKRINPELELKIFNQKVERENIKDLFNDCSVVVECLDRADYKSMLVEEALALGKFVVAVSGLGGIGSSDDIKIYRIKNNLVVIGDLKSDISIKPAMSPRVNIAAAKQADVVLGFILNLC
jgi:sulfur carrier protein ThiS adenylyltransferase